MFILSRYLRASNGANIYSGRCMEDVRISIGLLDYR
ncbi:hypothetical protein PI125_g23436, partial [Phytophthora idaei]